MANKVENSQSHPKHYKNHPSGVECITITKHHNFCVGNIIKYAWRLGLKDGESSIKDLEKIINYAQFEIDRIKEIEYAEKKDD